MKMRANGDDFIVFTGIIIPFIYSSNIYLLELISIYWKQWWMRLTCVWLILCLTNVANSTYWSRNADGKSRMSIHRRQFTRYISEFTKSEVKLNALLFTYIYLTINLFLLLLYI